MVFRDSIFAIRSIGTLATLSFLMMGGSACSSRGEKNVAMECAPGQTKGSDGKCQAAAQPATPTPTDFQPLPPQEQQAEEQQGEQNDETTLLPGGEQDQPTTQQQPDTKPDPQPDTKPDLKPDTQPVLKPDTQPVLKPDTQPSENDPMNISETATPMFTEAPATASDGAPLIALKLVTSPAQGKVARAAFSYVTGVTEAKFTYHKKVLTAKGSPFSDGSMILDVSALPVSLSFKWDSKTCETGVVDVGFEAKTAKVTCK